MKEWNGEELEEAGEKAGIPMPLARNIKDVLKMDAFTKNLGLMPLVSVEKVGESDPIPFTPNPKTPLDGIRLLSSSHVIAVRRRAEVTASGFRWYARLSGFPSWASSIATTRKRRPAQTMSTAIRIPTDSLSIRQWVATPASRK